VLADQGVYVTAVIADSPAHLAGVQRGDIVVWIDNNPVTGIDELQALLTRTPPGKNVVLRVCRANQVSDVPVITAAKW
jgi:S1-C subfamily serine protease